MDLWEEMNLFGMNIPTKWYVTYEINNITYYLASANEDARNAVWTQRVDNAIKFESSTDAEKVMVLIKSHRKHNKKAIFRVK